LVTGSSTSSSPPSNLAASSTIAATLAAALDWWREAGVDGDFTDLPQDWLADASPAAAAAQAPLPEPPKPAPRMGGDAASWPIDLAEFAAWWQTEPSLAAPGLQRISPSGPREAALMVLVAMPDEGDRETLLSGKAGQLLAAMLTAMGLERDQVYLASALPVRTTLPDWEALASAGLGAVLAHHVGLVSPQRLLVFGRGGISTLLGNGSAQTAATLGNFNHDGGSVQLMVAVDLEALLASPGLKSGLWNRWLEWTGIPQQ
jgi:uracil-DNA glycosylase